MKKRYRMEDLGIEALVGRTIKSAQINEEKDLVVLDTDKGKLYLTWEGDCCAHCYLVNIVGMAALIDATILEANHSEWSGFARDKEDYDIIEQMGTSLKTTKGYVTFESRLEHNGYYGGTILVSDKEPMDQYSSPRYEGKLPKLLPLEDF